MDIERTSKDTLTAVELDVDDRLLFTMADGRQRTIVVRAAGAEVESRGRVWSGEADGVRRFRINCTLEIDGHLVQLVRTIPTQQNFSPPYELFGLRLWLDAAGDMTQILSDTHASPEGRNSPCFSERALRIAVWDQRERICPVLLHPWCPLPSDGLKIEDCYRGEDVWTGPYRGSEAHNGLDINHPAGTRLWTPIAIDEHRMFHSIARGDENNRWWGAHHWDNGSTWILQSHHLIRMLVPEDRPIPAGTAYAESGGMNVGAVEHSHFVFRVLDDGTEVLIDPWLLFWQMYEDRRLTTAAAR